MSAVQRIILALSLLIVVSVIPLAGCGSSNPANVTASTFAGVLTRGFSPSYFYINAVTGSDTNSGASSSVPFKTITKALNLANSMPVNGAAIYIYVAPGTYNAANGEVFPLRLTNNVKLIGDVANKGVGFVPTKIQGNGQAASFYTVTTGSVLGLFGSASRQATVLVPAGITGVSIQGFNIGGAFDNDILIDQATATIDSNTTTIMPGAAGNDIGVFNQSNVTITNNVFSDDSWYAHLEVMDSAAAKVRNNVFNTSSWVVGILIEGKATAATSPTVDMGTPGTPGGNTILGRLGLYVLDVAQTTTIQVSGNTWKPNIQGADAAGHYTVGTFLNGTTVNYVPGNNYAVVNYMVGVPPSIQFYGTAINRISQKRVQ